MVSSTRHISPKLASALKKAKSLGRGGDTMLAHINPQEADILKRLGGSGKPNPHTGLPEFLAESDASYGGGGYGYGQSNYGSGGGGDTSGGWTTSYSSGGGGTTYGKSSSTTPTTTYRSAAAVDAATNNYGGGSYGVGGSSGPTANSGSGYSSGGSWNSPSSYSGGTSVSNSSSSRSSADSFGSALSAGAGMAKDTLTSIGSGMMSLGDSLNGWMSSAAPTVNAYGSQVANTLGEASDSLNAGIATGYNYAKDFISNALNPQAPQSTPSYTQMAAASGNPGFRSEAASGGYDAPSPEAPAAPARDYLGDASRFADNFGGAEIASPFVGTPMGLPPTSHAQMLSTLGINNADTPAEGASPAYDTKVNPDVSYALRFNPGTMTNAEYIKGAQIKDQFPNVDFGGLSNTDVGKIVTRTIAGEAAGEGQLGQQLVGSNIMNRLTLANQGIGLAGNFGPYASFRDVMRGYDANGFDKGRTQSNSVYNNPGATTEQNAFNALSAVLSPNAAINQARTNPMAAMELGAQYGVSPEAIANAVQSTHYYDPKYANPKWGSQMANAAQVGNHLFGSLDTSPRTWGVVNGVMTGFNIPNPGSQVATGSPVASPADVPAPGAVTVGDMPPQVLPSRPVTPTPSWAYNTSPDGTPSPSTVAHLETYDAPVGVNPNGYAEPLTLPAQPEKGVGTLFNTAFNLTPLGIPNAIASLFGYSVGDMVANRANIPMTPEEALAAENRMYAQGEGKGSKSGQQTASQADATPQQTDVIKVAKAMASATSDWKKAALAHGYSEAQLADPEVAALIKQIYDIGLIPKLA